MRVGGETTEDRQIGCPKKEGRVDMGGCHAQPQGRSQVLRWRSLTMSKSLWVREQKVPQRATKSISHIPEAHCVPFVAASLFCSSARVLLSPPHLQRSAVHCSHPAALLPGPGDCDPLRCPAQHPAHSWPHRHPDHFIRKHESALYEGPGSVLPRFPAGGRQPTEGQTHHG